ncbi:MAG TPA: LOG family protein, partial [Gemmataceae bacterium]|nr:LOG family protein [Gemmataceae bacterium]
MKPQATSGSNNSFEQIHEEAHPEDRHPLSIDQFVQQLKETADKLIRDQANRGDVKMLSTALKELRYAFKVFAPYRQRRKVTIFGSARIKTDHPAYAQAVAFSRRMAEAGYMVITGAASGIMEAGHVGAGRESSIGVNILLPFEQQANAVIAGDVKLMHLKYFFTRKLLFVKESDAIALFPGGFGTQDECFEVLTLVQTGKSHLFPIVMVDEPGGDYWQQWQRYIKDVLLTREMISPADLALYKVTDSVDAAFAEILGFYR